MEHHALLVTIALGLVLAFAMGFIASRLRLPPLVGYLLAGIIVGPHTPGIVVDASFAMDLSEIGVILLMFGVGLHFSMADLFAVRWIAVPGAVLQIAAATAMGTLMAMAWGWTPGAGLVLGLALSVASTVVLLRALDEHNVLATGNGRIAVGWLIVEDLAMVLALVLLPAFAGVLGGTATGAEGSTLVVLGITLGKLALFGAIVMTAGPRFVPWILGQAARTGSHELFTLCVLAIALGIAYGASALFDVSFALGAFAAGIVLAKSELSHRAAEESLPLQHAFAVLFFVSVGMLFDPAVLLRDPMALVGVLLIILVGKTVVAFAIVMTLGYPVSTALMVSASLAQIGEFSFILAGLGLSLGLLPPEARDFILGGALLSITLNPLIFGAMKSWAGRLGTAAVFAAGDARRLARLQALEGELGRREVEPAQLGLQPDQLMKKFPVFADLTDGQQAELLALFKPRSAAPGERVIRAGDAGHEMFFISSGAVEVSIGAQRVQLGPGEVFGEMALLLGGVRTADVTAIDYCLFLMLERNDFEQFVARHPSLRAPLDRIAAERARMNVREGHAAG
jgi:monovalent cation:H+ antiporter-2, CPA2 family